MLRAFLRLLFILAFMFSAHFAAAGVVGSGAVSGTGARHMDSHEMTDFFSKIRTNPDFNPKDIPDLTVLNEYRQSYLQEAIAWRPSLADYLIDHGINIDNRDYKGATALQFALAWKNYEIAKKLILKGANLSLRDKFGNDALWTAVVPNCGNYEIVELLMENGSDPFVKNKAGRSVADIAEVMQNEKLKKLFGLPR